MQAGQTSNHKTSLVQWLRTESGNDLAVISFLRRLPMKLSYYRGVFLGRNLVYRKVWLITERIEDRPVLQSTRAWMSEEGEKLFSREGRPDHPFPMGSSRTWRPGYELEWLF